VGVALAENLIFASYYQFKNLIEAINGGEDNSFISRWGGEILFDNFRIHIDESIGTDKGIELLYGKNIPADGLTESVDTREVVTRIYPKAYNGYTITNNGYVDSDLINNYPIIKVAVMSFEDVKMRADASEDDEENGVTICDTQAELDAALTQKCKDQFASGLDKPEISISADMVLLQNTVQYKDFSVLESVSLGDTIHCKHYKLGIETEARVIELTYDCLKEKVSSVVLGSSEYNYFDNVTSSVNKIDNVVRPDGSLIAEQIKGFIDGTYSQLRVQNSIAKKQDVRAILFEDLDPDSPTFGALGIGTQGIQISKERNAQNTDWVWTTSTTFAGIIANTVVTGKISSKTGAVYFDLDANNGKGELASSVLKGVDDGVTTTAKIGSGNWAGGEPYQGFRISYLGGNSGLLLITIDGISEDFPLANKDEIVSNGDLIIRSNGISEYSGGASGLYLNGNSSTGEGTVIVKRGTKGKTNKNVFYADTEQLLVQYDGYNNYLRFSNTGCVLYDKNKIQFGTNGYMRASIESNGDAKFGNIYSNGSLVTSDRKKKTGVKKLSGTFLEKVRGSAVYRYRLKQDMIPEENAKNLKRKSVGTKNESVGLMYDEAPEEIRRETESGDKAIDLYGMVSILWKAVQELSDKVDSLQQKQEV